MPPSWTEQALCAQADPDLFFGDEAAGWQAHLAKKICADCPVLEKCLDYALKLGEVHFGIWGGMTAQERRAERRRRKAAAPGGSNAA